MVATAITVPVSLLRYHHFWGIGAPLGQGLAKALIMVKATISRGVSG